MGAIHELRFSIPDEMYERRIKLPREITNRAIFLKGVEAEEKEQKKKSKKRLEEE